MTLAYRAEYASVLGKGSSPPVQLVQEWLVSCTTLPRVGNGEAYEMLPHCTERTTAPAAVHDWRVTFEKFNLGLTIVPSGCCGMAGTWGHEQKNRALSEHIYGLSWGPHVASSRSAGTLLADGYSCRSQVKSIDGDILPHPVEILLKFLKNSRSTNSTGIV